MVRRRGRSRRATKWVGFGLCVTVLVAMGISLSGTLYWVSRSKRQACAVYAQELMVWILLPSKWPGRQIRPWDSITFQPNPWWLPYYFPNSELNADTFFLKLPLWMLLAGAGVPTALLFWLDWRRVKPGHCRQCGYDLTGNVSGRCPECGMAIQTGSSAPAQR